MFLLQKSYRINPTLRVFTTRMLEVILKYRELLPKVILSFCLNGPCRL